MRGAAGSREPAADDPERRFGTGPRDRLARYDVAAAVEFDDGLSALAEQPLHAARLGVERAFGDPGGRPQLGQGDIERSDIAWLVGAELDAPLEADLDMLAAARRQHHVGVPEHAGRPQEFLVERIARQLLGRIVVMVDAKAAARG